MPHTATAWAPVPWRAFGFLQGTNKGNAVLFDNLHVKYGVDTTNPLVTSWDQVVMLGVGEDSHCRWQS